ncbi:MAG: 3-hydroxyacyl-CoA dehydrogenase NAD-binding domain-containing protein [Lonepinella koalarum]|nr:3-hydroxyacyl-CoA dehydrogenase NAD-binding domain-containing protein [Lonepinella koalarum]
MSEVTQQISPFSLSVQDNIAVVEISTPDRTFNLFDGQIITQLREVIGAVIYQKLSGLIFISKKENNFIRGFDWTALEGKTEKEIADFALETQAVLREIEHLKVPTIAAIHGDCYGFGLELALACRQRIATTDQHTLFAMPQVRSGLLPFAGGTQRLPRLIGLKDAAPLLFTGNKINVKRALELGLIDQMTSKSGLLSTALSAISLTVTTEYPLSKIKHYWRKTKNFLEVTPLTRNQALEKVQSHISLKAFDNYPAGKTLMKVLQETDCKLGLQAERDSLCELFFTEQSRVLRHLERTTRAMKLQYKTRGDVRDVKNAAILGSGYLGAGIAYITAHRANLPVRIKDIHLVEIQKALYRTSILLQREVEQGNLSEGKMRQTMQLISGGERFIGKPSADFVIEAVYEDVALKQQMLQEAFAYFGKNIVYATNTSTLSVGEIAQNSPCPEHVIGFHYFSPVSERKMLEIIPHNGTSEHTIATAIHFAIQQGKIPFLVADTPAFFVNRILTPYLLEAVQCLLDGESIEFIDRSLQEFGFAIGPLAMIDDMGLDVLMKSLPNLVEKLGTRFMPPTKMQYLMEDERKGEKNNRGFYLYHSQTGERTAEDGSIYYVLEVVAANDLEAEQIVRRCILMMINEAAYCLQEKVIRSTEEGNVASVLGAFFPDFRGGIYAYIEKIGAKNIVAELNAHVKLYGERFTPCEWLIQQAEKETQAA